MTTTMEDYSVSGIIQLKDDEFRLISELIYEKFGVNLTEKKKALVRGRLNTHVKSLGYDNFNDYYASVIRDPTGSSLLSLIDKISTNHSYFFREGDHFDFLTENALPEICESLRRQGSRHLRIWCAGCAAGEEPYTLAMVLKDFFGLEFSSWEIGILATDISTTALEQAVEGVYPANRLSKTPEKYRQYFVNAGGDNYKIADSIKKMVYFKRLNLMRDTYPFSKKFHVIFCRNVMIYFDQQTKKDLVAKFCRYTAEGGYLFIGHSESLGQGTEPFTYIRPTVYRK